MDKMCSKCKEIKDADTSFFKRTDSSGCGYRSVCKQCMRLYDLSRKDILKEYRHEYYLENTESTRKRDALNRKIRKEAFYSISQKEMLDLVEYDPTTGTMPKAFYIGKEHDYLYINVNKYRVPAHRLAWFLTHGEWPDEVDHKNGNTSDNSIDNLRGCTGQENMCNLKLHRDGRLVGATYYKSKNVWLAQKTINGRNKHIGTYATEREASLKYCQYVLQNNLVRREFLPDTFTDEELYSEL
jgi:hypothetical protein